MTEPDSAARARGQRTISDFGEQWTTYTDNSGFYGSAALLSDVFGPLLETLEIRGGRIADVGAGTGRWTRILVEAGAVHVTALEPSDAFRVLQENTRDLGDRVTLVNVTGDRLPAGAGYDLVFSYGVLHHVPEPAPVVRAAMAALRPGGRCAIWLYGKEGNRAYLLVLGLLTSVTRRLPHRALAALTWLLYGPLAAYMVVCRLGPLPLSDYMRQVFSRLDPDKRRLVIYDQLNPAYARYYTEAEARSLLEREGFTGVQVYHRHGYSWSVVGARPASTQ